MKCECGESFTNLNDFYIHLCDKYGRYLSKGCQCAICEEKFNYWTELGKHLANDEKKCVDN